MEQVVEQLAVLIQELGKPIDQMSPAIYDTAYGLIHQTHRIDRARALDWLASQQNGDGGWGEPYLPHTRIIPTLSAALALHHLEPKLYHVQIVRAMAFLREFMSGDTTKPHDGIPVAGELIIPNLVAIAKARHLELPALHPALAALGQRRRYRLANISHRAGTPSLYSWEAWGTKPEACHVDSIGSVGNSPAATVAWIAAARYQANLQTEIRRAQSYLMTASAATGSEILGILPTVWPVENYERAFSLYMLAIAGLLHHSAFFSLVKPQIDQLRSQISSDGIGMSQEFVSDSDTTATSLIALTLWDRKRVDLRPLILFQHKDHFSSYLGGELQPSISATAHAIYALKINNIEPDPALYAFLLERQGFDGLWRIDKWNVRWSYATSRILLALDSKLHALAISRAITAICREQHEDGGWGDNYSRREETAYIILALRLIRRFNSSLLHEVAQKALLRAEKWMITTYNTPRNLSDGCWLGKEIYHPKRLALLTELAATLPEPAECSFLMLRSA